MEWKRNCPKCNKEIFYTRKYIKIRAEKRNTNCKSCSAIGKIFSDEHKKRIGESNKGKSKFPNGRVFTKNHCKKISKSKKGQVSWSKGLTKETDIRITKMSESLKGIIFTDKHKKRIGKSNKGKKCKPFTDEHKKNQRLSAIKRIKKQNGQILPNYNPNALPIIEQKARELGITDLQHAENGGEYSVCGYFVDGYSPNKNIVIEYYEKAHERTKERDERRKREIIKELGCKFIEIKEWEI